MFQNPSIDKISGQMKNKFYSFPLLLHINYQLQKSLPVMPVQPNVFKLEMTPPSPTLDPDKLFRMTLKNLATTKQKVIVAVESALFELHFPTKTRWPLTQHYAVLEPGYIMNLSIEVTKELRKGGTKEILSRMTKPEGKLRIYHQTYDLNTNDAEHWSHDCYEEDEHMYHPDFTVKMEMDSEKEWGYVEIELSCKKETELMKNQRKQFAKMKKRLEKKSNCIVS